MNAATDTLCSTLTTCLDDICPLSPRPARTAPSNPWLSDVLHEHRTRLRAAERKWRKSKEPSDLSMYQSFLTSFSAEVHTAKSSHFHNKINNAPDMRNLFRTFNYLLCPPSPPPTTSITADDLRSFYTCTVESILTGCITAWFGNSTAGNRRALQRVVRTARHIVGGELPSLQDIYTRRCTRKARRIIKDSSHPSHRLLSLLPSGRCLRSIRSRTSRLRDSFFPQAIRLMNIQK